MKYQYLILIFCTYISLSIKYLNANHKFNIIIPSYSNSKWFKNNLDSVFSQTYTNYHIYYIDDHSPDNTAQLVENYIKEKNMESKVTLIKNNKRKHAMYNRYKAINMCAANSIIVMLDGDDWLAHPQVLETLNKKYLDKNVWMTYGQYLIFPSLKPGSSYGLKLGQAIPIDILIKNTIRKNKIIPTHILTFYAGLFHKINVDDLKYNGSFLQMAHSAFIYPIVEMAGIHCLFIPEYMYIYNKATGINDHTVNRELQKKLSNLIKDRKRYKPINKPF